MLPASYFFPPAFCLANNGLAATSLASFCLARIAAFFASSAATAAAPSAPDAASAARSASLRAFFSWRILASRSARCAGVKFSVLPLEAFLALFLAFFSLESSRESPRAISGRGWFRSGVFYVARRARRARGVTIARRVVTKRSGLINSFTVKAFTLSVTTLFDVGAMRRAWTRAVFASRVRTRDASLGGLPVENAREASAWACARCVWTMQREYRRGGFVDFVPMTQTATMDFARRASSSSTACFSSSSSAPSGSEETRAREMAAALEADETLRRRVLTALAQSGVVQRDFDAADTNNDGVLDKREFMLALSVDESAPSVGGKTTADSGGDATITSAQARALMLSQAVPFIGFGFCDNAVMILAGESIETALGVGLGLSTMASAAFGNTVSDVVGIGLSSKIESFAERLGFHAPALTKAQRMSSATRWAKVAGATGGVTLGCVLGTFPLWMF